MRKQISIIAAVVLVFALGAGFAFALTAHKASGDSCNNPAAITRMVTITEGHVSAPDIHGKLCDKIMFMNEDNLTREIAFGPHEDHVPYDGVAEKFLNQYQSFTITLNTAGRYHWHDHLHDEVQGYFTVTK